MSIREIAEAADLRASDPQSKKWTFSALGKRYKVAPSTVKKAVDKFKAAEKKYSRATKAQPLDLPEKPIEPAPDLTEPAETPAPAPVEAGPALPEAPAEDYVPASEFPPELEGDPVGEMLKDRLPSAGSEAGPIDPAAIGSLFGMAITAMFPEAPATEAETQQITKLAALALKYDFPDVAEKMKGKKISTATLGVYAIVIIYAHKTAHDQAVAKKNPQPTSAKVEATA